VEPLDDPRAPGAQSEPRPFTLKLIIGYKFAKAPLVLMLALLLTVSPRSAEHIARALVHELSEGGALLAKLGNWLGMHVSRSNVRHAAFIAWGDGLMTSLEGVLLLRGHAWGEWIVVVGLAALVPFEIISFEHRPGPLKIAVLALNVAIVLYLAARRWQQRGRHGHSSRG
jgi:hypothetical protein